MSESIGNRPIRRDETFVRYFDYAPIAHGIWADTENGLMQARDLGLGSASEGDMSARHIRTKQSKGEISLDRTFDRMCLLYVLCGSISISGGGFNRASLGTGDTINLPPGTDHRLSEVSDDFEALEIVWPHAGPAEVVVTRESGDAYVAGDGPRTFFTYRDLGSAKATGNAVHIQIVKPIARPTGGTGWHYHSMGQFAYGLAGWAKVGIVGQETFTLKPGDGLCICAGLEHVVPDFSEDYAVLEMCVPAEYDTVATMEPQPRPL